MAIALGLGAVTAAAVAGYWETTRLKTGDYACFRDEKRMTACRIEETNAGLEIHFRYSTKAVSKQFEGLIELPRTRFSSPRCFSAPLSAITEMDGSKGDKWEAGTLEGVCREAMGKYKGKWHLYKDGREDNPDFKLEKL